jgi:hypothetical protein
MKAEKADPKSLIKAASLKEVRKRKAKSESKGDMISKFPTHNGMSDHVCCVVLETAITSLGEKRGSSKKQIKKVL